MNPFDNVSSEEGVQDKRPKRTYRAQQGHNGRFIDNVLDMSEGLHAEDITPVEKAFWDREARIKRLDRKAGRQFTRAEQAFAQGKDSKGERHMDRSWRADGRASRLYMKGYKSPVEKALVPMPKIPKIPGAPKPPKAPTAPKTFKAPVPSTKAPNPGKPKVKESGIMKSLVPLQIAPNPQLRSKRQAAAQKAARTRMAKSMWTRPVAELQHGLKSSDPLVRSMARAALQQRGHLPRAPRPKTFIAKAAKDKKDYSGTLVGTGSVAAGTGLVGGGIPGTKPNSAAWAERPKSRRKWPLNRHVRTAAKGGIFGYRADAHEGFLGQEKDRLPNWKPHSRTNAFERGVVRGRLGPERQVIRHMKRGRAASNVALGVGAGMVGTGLYQRSKNKKISKGFLDSKTAKVITYGGAATGIGAGTYLALSPRARGQLDAKNKASGANALGFGATHKYNRKTKTWDKKTVSKAKRDDYKADTALAAGGTLAAGGYGGSMALEQQGRKWSTRASENLSRAQKLNPRLGGHDVKYPRGTDKTPKAFRGVPRVNPHRSTGDIQWNSRESLMGRSSKVAEKAGKLRGAATQQRYFAREYGKTAKYARKAGKAGLLIGAAGVGGKTLQMRDDIRKGMPERGELVARQFPIEAHQRRAHQRRVRKSGPDQADVHVPGHGSRKNRKPKYQLSMRPLERAPE